MKIKLLLSLAAASCLLTENRLNAMSPLAIFAVSDAVNNGASIVWEAKATAAGFTIGQLARFGIAEIGIFSGLALSMGIKKDTTLIRRSLTHLTKLTETITQKMFENAMRNSAEHRATQESIANLSTRLENRVDNVFLNQSRESKAMETRLAAQIRSLDAKISKGVASKKDIRRLMQLIIKQNKEQSTRMQTLEENQNKGYSALSNFIAIFSRI